VGQNRTKKEKRRLRRKRKSINAQAGGPVERIFSVTGEGGQRRALSVEALEVTEESMPDPVLERMDPADQEEAERISQAIIYGTREEREAPGHLPALERLIEKYPHVPQLHNYRMNALRVRGDEARADELAVEIYQRFPDYLFGFVGYIELLLEQGDLKEAERLLEGRLHIKQYAPRRWRFHMSEFLSYQGMVMLYHLACGELEAAERTLAGLEEMQEVLEIDHPTVKALKARLNAERLRHRMRKMFWSG